MPASARVPADDQDVWFRVRATLKLEFCGTAHPLWDGRSASWRSLRRMNGVTLGAVYHIASERGFNVSGVLRPQR